MELKMKYALIGCGRIAGNHIQAALDNGLELTAVCDTIPGCAESLLRKFGLEEDCNIHRYTDYKQMFREHPEIDLCAVASDSGSHARIALDCIQAGMHLIIEKPIAMSIKDAEDIIRQSRKKGVTVSVCHQNRFNSAIQAVRRAREEGRFGTLSHGAVHVRWFRDASYYRQAEWRGKWSSDGGCLMNQCIHGIDLLVWLMGSRVTKVYGTIRRRQHPYIEAEDIGMAVLEFADGTVAEIEGSTNVYPSDLEETLLVCGDKGTVKIGGPSATRIEYWKFTDRKTEDETVSNLDEQTENIYGNGHSRLYRDVITAVQEGRRPCADAEAGRNALEIVLAIYESQRTGMPVSLPLSDFSSAEMEGIFDSGHQTGRRIKPGQD